MHREKYREEKRRKRPYVKYFKRAKLISSIEIIRFFFRHQD